MQRQAGTAAAERGEQAGNEAERHVSWSCLAARPAAAVHCTDSSVVSWGVGASPPRARAAGWRCRLCSPAAAGLESKDGAGGSRGPTRHRAAGGPPTRAPLTPGPSSRPRRLPPGPARRPAQAEAGHGLGWGEFCGAATPQQHHDPCNSTSALTQPCRTPCCRHS